MTFLHPFLCACSVSYNVIFITRLGISLCYVFWGEIIAFIDPTDTAGEKNQMFAWAHHLFSDLKNNLHACRKSPKEKACSCLLSHTVPSFRTYEQMYWE